MYIVLVQADCWVAAHSESEAVNKACDWLHCSADDIDVTQDADVLDTWFSSALFPFAVFGWPDQVRSQTSQTYINFLCVVFYVLSSCTRTCTCRCG